MKSYKNLTTLFLLTTASHLLASGSSHDHAKAWEGKTYNAHSSLQYDLDRQMLSKIIFNGNEAVLDVGCGNGAITSIIADQVPTGYVVGIDCSPSMINFAQEEFQTQKSNLAFSTCYAEDLTYREEFDIVTSFCMLHWAKDFSKSLKNIYAALKKKGTAFLFFPVSYNNPWRELMASCLYNQKWTTAFEKNKPAEVLQPCTKESLEQICHEVGFNEYEVSVEIIPYTFHNVPAFKEWFKELAWYKAVPDEYQAEFLDLFVEKIQNYSPSQDGTCTIYPSYAIIKATKKNSPFSLFLSELKSQLTEDQQLNALDIFLLDKPQDATFSGEEYYKNATVQHTLALNTLNETLSFKGNEDILELGSADGFLSSHLATLVPSGSVTGLEANESMLNFAQSHYRDKQKNLSFEQQDWKKISYTNKFDVITSFFAIHNTTDLGELLERMYISLKKGGRGLLLIQTPGQSSFHESFAKVIAKPKWKKFLQADSVHLFSNGQTAMDIHMACQNSEVPFWNIGIGEQSYTFSDKNDFIRWIKSMDSIFGIIPWNGTPSNKLEELLLEDLYNECCPNNTINIGVVVVQIQK